MNENQTRIAEIKSLLKENDKALVKLYAERKALIIEQNNINVTIANKAKDYICGSQVYPLLPVEPRSNSSIKKLFSYLR